MTEPNKLKVGEFEYEFEHEKVFTLRKDVHSLWVNFGELEEFEEVVKRAIKRVRELKTYSHQETPSGNIRNKDLAETNDDASSTFSAPAKEKSVTKWEPCANPNCKEEVASNSSSCLCSACQMEKDNE